MKSFTKHGFMAEHYVAADLIKKGYIPCMPTVPASEFDILAVKGQTKVKVQVKSGAFDGNKMKVDLRKGSAKERKYSEDDVDVYALHDRTSGGIAYLYMEDYVGRSQVTLYRRTPESLHGYTDKQRIILFSDCNLREKAS